MSKQRESKGGANLGECVPWLDESTDAPLIHQYAEKMTTFADAMADGKIDKHELKAQEERVVALMKSVEPQLDPKLHDEVTRLICELTAYNVMHTIHGLIDAAPKTRFQG